MRKVWIFYVSSCLQRKSSRRGTSFSASDRFANNRVSDSRGHPANSCFYEHSDHECSSHRLGDKMLAYAGTKSSKRADNHAENAVRGQNMLAKQLESIRPMSGPTLPQRPQ